MLTINRGKCIEDLKAHLMKSIIILQEEFLIEAQNGMRTKAGADDLTAEVIIIISDHISANVIGGAYAVMDNYGTGSKMDTENPALSEYMNSDIWNPVRHGTAIVGREKGNYTNIFGKEAYSSGKFEGQNMEASIKAQAPSHALETAARWMGHKRVQEVISDSLKSFDMSKYIVFK